MGIARRHTGLLRRAALLFLSLLVSFSHGAMAEAVPHPWDMQPVAQSHYQALGGEEHREGTSGEAVPHVHLCGDQVSAVPFVFELLPLSRAPLSTTPILPLKSLATAPPTQPPSA